MALAFRAQQAGAKITDVGKPLPVARRFLRRDGSSLSPRMPQMAAAPFTTLRTECDSVASAHVVTNTVAYLVEGSCRGTDASGGLMADSPCLFSPRVYIILRP